MQNNKFENLGLESLHLSLKKQGYQTKADSSATAEKAGYVSRKALGGQLPARVSAFLAGILTASMLFSSVSLVAGKGLESGIPKNDLEAASSAVVPSAPATGDAALDQKASDEVSTVVATAASADDTGKNSIGTLAETAAALDMSPFELLLRNYALVNGAIIPHLSLVEMAKLCQASPSYYDTTIKNVEKQTMQIEASMLYNVAFALPRKLPSLCPLVLMRPLTDFWAKHPNKKPFATENVAKIPACSVSEKEIITFLKRQGWWGPAYPILSEYDFTKKVISADGKTDTLYVFPETSFEVKDFVKLFRGKASNIFYQLLPGEGARQIFRADFANTIIRMFCDDYAEGLQPLKEALERTFDGLLQIYSAYHTQFFPKDILDAALSQENLIAQQYSVAIEGDDTKRQCECPSSLRALLPLTLDLSASSIIRGLSIYANLVDQHMYARFVHYDMYAENPTADTNGLEKPADLIAREQRIDCDTFLALTAVREQLFAQFANISTLLCNPDIRKLLFLRPEKYLNYTDSYNFCLGSSNLSVANQTLLDTLKKQMIPLLELPIYDPQRVALRQEIRDCKQAHWEKMFLLEIRAELFNQRIITEKIAAIKILGDSDAHKVQRIKLKNSIHFSMGNRRERWFSHL